MIAPELKQKLLAALDRYHGDELDRATRAFARCTPEQMQQQYLSSDQTRQEILDMYSKHEARVKRAIEYVRSL